MLTHLCHRVEWFGAVKRRDPNFVSLDRLVVKRGVNKQVSRHKVNIKVTSQGSTRDGVMDSLRPAPIGFEGRDNGTLDGRREELQQKCFQLCCGNTNFTFGSIFVHGDFA